VQVRACKKHLRAAVKSNAQVHARQAAGGQVLDELDMADRAYSPPAFAAAWAAERT
jgi:hypothetical protein